MMKRKMLLAYIEPARRRAHAGEISRRRGSIFAAVHRRRRRPYAALWREAAVTRVEHGGGTGRAAH